jgi:hypothetical protein
MERKMRRKAVVLGGLVMILVAGLVAGLVARYAQGKPRGTAGEMALVDAQGGTGIGAASGRIADFAWLAGRWTGVAGTQTAEEICTEASHHVMGCMIRYMDAENVKELEFITLREMPIAIGGPPMQRRADDSGNMARDRVLTTVEERVRFFGTDLTEKAGDEGITLRLASVSAAEIVFDNAKVDGAVKHLRFIRNGSDELTSHLDLVGADGKPGVVEAKWKRAK